MNILYLHGLKSKLSEPKRKFLEKYGKVYAPDIAYDSHHVQPKTILSQFSDVEFNVVIGSSMGALNAYIISDVIGRPALVFNPPLAKHQAIDFPTGYTKGLASKQILLGGEDDIVDPTDTLEFLKGHLQKEQLQISIDPKLGHRIPLDIFEEQVKSFFSQLCY
jgi:uncharacterized protein